MFPEIEISLFFGRCHRRFLFEFHHFCLKHHPGDVCVTGELWLYLPVRSDCCSAVVQFVCTSFFYLDCLCLPAFSPRVFICCNPRRRLYWNRGGWREGESDREIGRDGEKGKRVDRKVEREWERYRECVSGHIFSCISCTLACLSVWLSLITFFLYMYPLFFLLFLSLYTLLAFFLQ